MYKGMLAMETGGVMGLLEYSLRWLVSQLSFVWRNNIGYSYASSAKQWPKGRLRVTVEGNSYTRILIAMRCSDQCSV